MERPEAISRLAKLVGQDLRPLADKYAITVWKAGKKNKGWAGHVIERHLGLALNSSRAPNFGSWELKMVSLKDRAGILSVKETMAITMLDPVEVLQKPFEQSHLLAKLSKLIIVSRIFQTQADDRSIIYSIGQFDIGDTDVFLRVRQDYEEVRKVLKRLGPLGLSGRMGILVQPRTKGAGHGSVSRAFYARTQFVRELIGLQQPALDKWERGLDGTLSYIRGIE